MIEGQDERPDGHHVPRPQEETATRYSTGQKTALSLGGLVVALALGSQFLHGPASVPPTSPAQSAAQTPAAADQGRHVSAQLALIAPQDAARALAHSALSPTDQARALAGVRDRRLRLVEMPVFDPGGHPGAAISISTAGFTQSVTLTPRPVPVILPIAAAGEVDLSPLTQPGLQGLPVGAIFALGPTVLPSFSSLGDRLILDVIVQ